MLVLGAGAIGLLCAAVSKSQGAGPVVIGDIQESRTHFATKNAFADAGFTVPLRSSIVLEERLATAQDTARLARENGRVDEGFDVVFECTGVEASTQSAIYVS